VIHDAASFSERMVTRPNDLRAYLLAFYPDAPIPPTDHVVLTATPLVARVNHGVWIASCDCGARGTPAPGCVVWLSAPLGFCVRCLNRGWGGGWRPLVVPEASERAAIEAVLVCRPKISDRNWEPGETIAVLADQNREHGDPLPEEA
jgi:hypothetical protein